MLPKMKEIWKVVQKLSREQNSAAGGVQKHKVTPVYWGDLIIMFTMQLKHRGSLLQFCELPEQRTIFVNVPCLGTCLIPVRVLCGDFG